MCFYASPGACWNEADYGYSLGSLYRLVAALSGLSQHLAGEHAAPPLSEPLVYLLAFGYGLTPLVGEVEYLGAIGVLRPLHRAGDDRRWGPVSILF